MKTSRWTFRATSNAITISVACSKLPNTCDGCLLARFISNAEINRGEIFGDDVVDEVERVRSVPFLLIVVARMRVQAEQESCSRELGELQQFVYVFSEDLVVVMRR